MNAFDLRGVTVVDTRDGSLRPNTTIVVEDGKIAHLAPATSSTENGRRSVDAGGAFVVPGFLECHAHPLNAGDPVGYLTMMLAHGITGVRQMSGTPQALAARRDGTLMPAVDVPELLEMPGEILTRTNAPNPQRVVEEIHKQRDAGADFIKVIEVDRETFYAGLAECTRLGLRYIGHLPPEIDIREAAQRGMRSVEHLGPRDTQVLACSTDETALRAGIAARKRPPSQISGPIPEHVIRRAIALPTLLTDPAEFTRYRRVIDTYSDEKCRELAAFLATTGMWQVPTLIRIRTMQQPDDRSYREDPNLRYVPLATRQMWQELSEQFEAKLSTEIRAMLKELFALQLGLVKPLHRAGVKLMAGSDTGGGWVIPGVGLHREFDLLAEAGLSPLEVLQLTTINGAQFLGREATLGSIDEGKNADLVLLGANPIADVANLHQVTGVVRAGRYYSAAQLDAMKQRTEQRLRTWAPAPDALKPPCC